MPDVSYDVWQGNAGPAPKRGSRGSGGGATAGGQEGLDQDAQSIQEKVGKGRVQGGVRLLGN